MARFTFRTYKRGSKGYSAAIFRDGIHCADVEPVLDPAENAPVVTEADRRYAGRVARDRIRDLRQIEGLRERRRRGERC